MGVTQRAASLGVGQSWQDVTASRAFSTLYTNNTGKPIQVAVIMSSFSQLRINGGVVPYWGGSAPASIVFVVPVGATYWVSGTTLSSWWELR